MRTFGFSTGALAKCDVTKALHIAAHHGVGAVEYSALRIAELEPMVNFLTKHGIGKFHYAALHAPSRFTAQEEPKVVALLRKLVDKGLSQIVVHPDAIHDHALWQDFGDKLCVENMDHRKQSGRTADELHVVFAKLPKARLCFDIGHAHEIDRSMSVSYEILRRYRDRIAHIHASEVSDDCEHRAFTESSQRAFRKVADLIPEGAPVILEADLPESRVGSQLSEAKRIFRRSLTIRTTVRKREAEKQEGSPDRTAYKGVAPVRAITRLGRTTGR
jgi:Xylose isomerase-like TIM barrel